MSTSLLTCNVTSSNFSQRFWAIIHELSIYKLRHLIMKSRKDTMFIELKIVNTKRTGEIKGCIISNFYYKEIQTNSVICSNNFIYKTIFLSFFTLQDKIYAFLYI
jgi:hypothetical protein